MEEELNFNNKIIIFELPEGEAVGSCSLNREQQEVFIQNCIKRGTEILENNGGVLVVPPRTKIKVMDL